jgi:predicted  nucleic acid-binding Zn-ribbon protein
MITSSKELTNLQHEIASLAKRQNDLEEIVLDCMERREHAQARVAELEAERDRVADELGEAEQRRKAVLAEIDADLEFVRKQRDTLAPDIPGDLLALYEKLRRQQGGVGAAALRQRRCEGCRLELGITELNEARTAAPDAVLRCESCRRILVRTPESGL